jgi:D-3-phosphoglycerate dehydrogenase
VADRIVVADKLAAKGLDLLRAVPNVEVVETVGQGADVLHAAIADAVGILVRSETKVPKELMDRAPGLKVIARAGVGTDTIDVAEATRRGIPVLYAPGANSTSAAEHTFALMLALVRKLPWASSHMAEGKWDRKPFEGTELHGKTLGILGLGRIGSLVARIGQGFGMRVIATDPYAGNMATLLGVPLLPLDELLAQSDIVTLHLKLTDETRRILNAQRIAGMKQGAVLVNVARGALVDDVALVDALRSGQIGGAALDVYDLEPLPADSVLRGAPNLLMTPHLGASTREAQVRVSVETAEAVREYLLKGDISAAVNRAALEKQKGAA